MADPAIIDSLISLKNLLILLFCYCFILCRFARQLQVFDANRDGKLQLSEMSKYVLLLFILFVCCNAADPCHYMKLSRFRLLPVRENFLCRQVFKVKCISYTIVTIVKVKSESNYRLYFSLSEVYRL